MASVGQQPAEIVPLKPERVDITWLKPVHLYVENDDVGLLRELNRQLRQGYQDQGLTKEQISRSVYVIRLTGSFVISYPRRRSPVLYVGRGEAPSRIASHLSRWLSDAFWFGSDTQVEIRMLIPRRRGRADFYKCVEADLIDLSLERNGSIPFFNRKREASFAGRIVYGPSQLRRFRQLLGVGSGKRPHWALLPTKSNPHFNRYKTGLTG